jgi:hypothetical protein
MAVFPQLGTGAFAQFPTGKRRRARTVLNQAADGSPLRVADPAGGSIEWRLEYRGLTDGELGNLQQFYAEMEGALNGFTFLDPVGNLLARTDELNDAAWTRGPLLNLTGGIADPMGGSNGWHAVNAGAGPQTIVQTLNAPAGYLYCLSVYGRAAAPTTVTLTVGAQRAERAVTTDWTRIVFTITGDPAASSIAFGVEIPANGAVDLFGPQVEAQPGASAYKSSVAGGVYEGARFRDNTFSYTTTDVNRHSATVNILYAEHL